MTVFVRIVRFNIGLGVDCSFVLLWDLNGEVGWSLGEIGREFTPVHRTLAE